MMTIPWHDMDGSLIDSNNSNINSYSMTDRLTAWLAGWLTEWLTDKFKL